ncbi:MAG: glycosyltransferase family 2 protein, partial [Pseudomonadales bacterium]|nr:glycosyltransferase family 2 protein [Pseudomonadales bacterium]
MKNKPFVSVIMPVFNHAKYVGRTINSLLAQTYTNWELIVVNDGSTDNTEEVVLSFLDPRIQYMTQSNQGVKNLARTINRGLAIAKGELVTMLPSDDLWPTYRLEMQVP